jgi:hypothetical protein
MEDEGPLRVPAPLTHPPHPPPPPAPAPEGANVHNALNYPLMASQSVIYTPTTSTPMSSLGNLDIFLHTLKQELHHSSK